MALTKTEKRFIKILLELKDINFSVLAQKLKITKQAVSKIKKRLEQKQILKNYSVNIDVNKISITIYAMIELNIMDSTHLSDFIESVKKKKEVIKLMESALPDTRVIMMCGFKELKDIDSLIFSLKNNYNGTISFSSIQLIHPEKIHKDTYNDLVLHSISEKPLIQKVMMEA